MGSIPEVHFFPRATRENAQGCKLYEYLALNIKGVEEGLEDLQVVREFLDMIPKIITRCTA